MSKRRSNYLARVQAATRREVSEIQNTHTQMCLDAAMIAANEVFKMGPKRAPAFAQAFQRTLMDIARMTVNDTRDMEYTKAKLDARLKEICGENFVPWDERYG